MTGNDPDGDGTRDRDPGPAAGDERAPGPVPVPRYPDPATPPTDYAQSGPGSPPPGPSFEDGGWGQPPVPAPPRPYDDVTGFQGAPPPGPALNLDGWRPYDTPTSYPQPQYYGTPPPGPDVSLGGWQPDPRFGSGDAPAGPWSGYREGWFRRLLARLRGRRPGG